MSRTALINIAIIVAIILLTWFGAWPSFQKTKDLRASISRLKIDIIEEKEAVERIKDLGSELETREEEIEKLEVAIPVKKDSSSMIALFEQAATQNGLALTNIEITDSDSNANPIRPTGRSSILDVFTVRLGMIGRYSSLRGFMKDMEASFPLMDISQINFSIEKTETEEGESGNLSDPNFSIDVVLETYYAERG